MRSCENRFEGMMCASNISIILLICVMSQSMHAMQENYFTSFLSYFPWLASKEPQDILSLRKNRNKFEQQLLVNKIARKKYPDQVPVTWVYLPQGKTVGQWFFELVLDPFYKKIIDDPTVFLHYCYSQKYHQDSANDFKEFTMSADLLNKCQHVSIDGYSALGAAIVAPDVSVKTKRDFVRQLMSFGFKLTQKDKVLAELMVYDSISVDHKKKMILLLSNYQKDNWCMLPHDVRKFIVYYMIDLFKDKSWPCPRFVR